MPKVNLQVNSTGNADKKVPSLTKSFLSASLAIEGLKIATKALINVSKEAVTAFATQEQAESQLNAVIKSTGEAAGVTSDEMLGLAKSLSEVTKFGDEAIIGAESMLLTFTKVGKEVIPAATETILNMSQAMGSDLNNQAIQLGKALNDPIQGIAALSRVGVQLTDEQKDLIQSFMDVGDIANAQKVILGELETQFGNSARAARDTFGGAIAGLKNAQGDLLESVGRVVSVLGKDFVKSSTDAANAINDFISDANNIAKIAGSFEVAKEIVSSLGKDGFEVLKDAVQPVVDAFKDLVPEGEGANAVFTSLGAIVQGLSSGMAILGKFVKANIQLFIDTIKIVIETVKFLKEFWEAATGKQSFKEAFSNISKIGDAFKDMGSNVVSNVKDIISTTQQEFATFTSDAASNADKYKNIWTETNKKIKDDFAKTQEEMTTKQEEENDKRDGNQKDSSEKQKTTWSDWSSGITSIVGNMFSTLQESSNSFYENQLSSLTDSTDTQIEQLNAQTEKELELAGVKQQTKSQILAAEIRDLQKTATKGLSIEDKTALQENLIEKKKRLKEAQIIEKNEEEKNKIMKKAQKKENDLKRKQFEANKAFSIANVWINAATAVMGFWASFASMGIPGIVLAAVMSAASLTMAGVQTGIIASQSPSFAEGGIVPGNSMSGDKVQANVNSGEAILKADDFDMLTSAIRNNQLGSGGVNIMGPVTIVANNPQELVEALNEIKDFELNRR